MKLLKNILLIVLSCLLLAGCAGPVPPSPEDEQAIKEVIMTYDTAYYNWDLTTMSSCVTPTYPLEDTETMLRNALGVYVEQGDLVSEDIEKYLEIEKKYYQMGAQQMKYCGWDIKVLEDTATALITYGYPNADENMPSYGEEMTAYRNELFMSACGMDEATAKATLSPEEFSAVYLQVTDMDYAKRSENLTYVENTVELRLQKVDGKWLIAELVLPEE